MDVLHSKKSLIGITVDNLQPLNGLIRTDTEKLNLVPTSI